MSEDEPNEASDQNVEEENMNGTRSEYSSSEDDDDDEEEDGLP